MLKMKWEKVALNFHIPVWLIDRTKLVTKIDLDILSFGVKEHLKPNFLYKIC